VPLVKAVQELSQQNSALLDENVQLKARMEALEAAVAELHTTIGTSLPQ
jgi:cell division protein FtsB